MNTAQFPDYLAFGKLNKRTFRNTGEFVTADYELLGEKVMEVSIKPGRAEIREFFQNDASLDVHNLMHSKPLF